MKNILHLKLSKKYIIMDENELKNYFRIKYKDFFLYLEKRLSPRMNDLYYKFETKDIILSSPEMSFMSCYGFIDNISINEKTFMGILPEPTNDILQIKSNFGILTNPKKEEIIKEVINPVIKEKSNRGRKKKEKRKSDRKQQGIGGSMNSQISFIVLNRRIKKSYNIKLFRNGKIQFSEQIITGIKDFIECFEIIIEFLQPYFSEPLKIKYIISPSRNYKCRILDEDILVSRPLLETVLYKEKTMKLENKININNFPKYFRDNIQYISDYYGMNDMNIFNIKNDIQKNPSALSICLKRDDNDSVAVINISAKGKITFCGMQSEEEMYLYYFWINHILKKYRDVCMFYLEDLGNDISSDSEEYISIYSDNP